MGRRRYPTAHVARSCDTAVALRDATADGSVMLAKNSDRDAGEAQRLIGVPAARHAAGTSVQCQYLTVPKVPQTAALIGSQPYWLWGFEHGLNEYGVAIGNEAIHTREAAQPRGLLGMDLLRLGLERGRTAQEALNTITGLLEQFGQGGSAAHHATVHYDNSFLIADPREAWVLETAGRRWVARHLTHGTYAISNRPTIGTEFDLASDDLVTYAEDRDWWPRGCRPFDFAAAYTDPDDPSLAGASCRLSRSLHHLQAGAPGRQSSLLTLADMMALLRDHGPAPDRHPPDRHPLDRHATDRHATDGGSTALAWPTGQEAATVCMHGVDGVGCTAASMVAHLISGARAAYWASMAPPCTGIFVPCWVDAAPPVGLALADETPDAASPWWRYRRLWERVALAPDPAAAVAQVRAAWRPLEERIRSQVEGLGVDAPAEARHAVSVEAVAEAMRVLSQFEAAMFAPSSLATA